MVGIPENGIGGMTLSLWTKNKNRRMDSELLEDLGDALIHNHLVERKRKRITGKYAIACTIFAYLNHILLGYGKLLLSFLSLFGSFFVVAPDDLSCQKETLRIVIRDS
ncbi:hypothetical protein SLEP1_g44847 [Rubroshorea leprosula]|uniref:Uncharacterized protein n=1 Tax=Rubroshorea leprosula TaxID=152421 RepID=A0AAV5LIQ3_9ROSI|nr:hypothetical protein SLEP1_g44847 [Rubroshorea leprosula]